jgi:hypothetical protein
MESAAPILVLAAAVGLGLVAELWGADTRDGFTEIYGNREPQRWFITPRR